MASLHISISAEPIAYIGQFAVTNSIFTSLLVSFSLIALALLANRTIKYTSRPQGLQNFLEIIVEGFHKLVNDITQSPKHTAMIFPVTLSFFLFILLNNWFGLLPGVGTIGITHHPQPQTNTFASTAHASADNVPITAGTDQPNEEDHRPFIPLIRPGSADLKTTLALAIFSIATTQIIGVKSLGLAYFTKFFNFKNVIFAFVGILELVSEFAKIISFAFRLFGNIFAGEVLLAVIAWLIPVAASIPFLFLEIMVGAIQALVFAMLSIVFMTMATQSHAEDH